jgi:hypothetical protein
MRFFFIIAILLLAPWTEQAALSQSRDSGVLRIEWEVKNRFRLFRNEADFQHHASVAHGESVLATEQRLARESDGRGWARDLVERLCLDRAGNLLETCERDGERENYLAPRDHRVGVLLAGSMPSNDGCVWTFDDGDGAPRTLSAACDDEVKLRVRYGRPTLASVDIVLPDGTAQRLVSDITVRDLLIAGMGDSIAAGEGDPDRAVRLSNEGFCFKRFNGVEYYRPGRAAYNGNKSCSTSTDYTATEWARHSARWMSGACHRSLYSYQTRVTLALAIEHPHIAVTFVPLGCSGATVDIGFLGSLRALECPAPGTGTSCPKLTRAQISALAEVMANAPNRRLDAVLLTIGANDVLFSGLMANVIVEPSTERNLLIRAGNIASIEASQKILDNELPANFVKLRAALKPFVGGDFSRIVFVTYGNPAMAGPHTPCPGGREGFDVHPAFGADGERLRETVEFVSQRFLPRLKALVLCTDSKNCRDPAVNAMRFVDAHQPAFEMHGACARGDDDPVFDRHCFSGKGETFRSGTTTAAVDPMSCGRSPAEFRPYAPRARWIRTANDSYLAAMSYPEGLPAILQASDLHDAMWGILAAVYGGAVHPTAEGYAAMADAALPALREAVNLAAPTAAVRREPLTAPSLLPAASAR